MPLNEDTITVASIIIVIILFILVSIFWVIMIISAFELHRAYKVGKAKENICGEFYLEGESARANIYNAYIGDNKDGVENRLKSVIQAFFWLVSLLLMLTILFYGIIAYKTPESFKPLLPKGLLLGGIGVGLVLLTILWMVFYNKEDESNTINPFSGVLFRVGEKLDEDAKSKLLGRQIGLLIGIAVTFGMLHAYISMYANGVEYYKTIMTSIWTIFIITSVFIPYITSIIYELNSNIKNYYGGKINIDGTGINSLVRSNLSNTLFSNNLRNNIKALDNLSETPATLSNATTDPYYNKFYRYVLNGVNMAEIRNIVIPEELSEIIDPVYLSGENIITMKYDFLRFYNSLISTRKTNFDNYIKIYLKDEYKTAAVFDSSFNCSTSLCGTGGGSLCAPAVKCNKVKSLVTKYILQNDTYKLNNIVPQDIRSILQDLRKDTVMEDSVISYFNSMNMLSIVLFIIIGYLLFHKMYQANREKFTGIVSFVMICLLLIIGVLGWFFKDLWL